MGKKLGACIVTMLMFSFGGNSFLSGGNTSKNKLPDNRNGNYGPNADANGNQFGGPFGNNPNDPNNPFGNPTNPGANFGNGNNGLGGGSGNDQLNDPQKCWFAVSGAYFGCHGKSGCGTYQSAFPGTTSGNPIKHGETFDIAGGVYLNSSDTPYEHRKGGREIDGAVDNSFDSIAVSPGVEVEIRDGNGNILLQGAGPMIRYASDHGSDDPGRIAPYFQGKVSEMPQWMATEFRNVNFRPTATRLHAARYVKVTKIPGVPCE